jgi:3'(2'), 5'-bisphosphate nucleotidase
VSQAAAAILVIAPGQVEQRQKPDHSPVTAADEAAQEIILSGLSRLLPGVPVVSEEAPRPRGTPVLSGPFVLVDPLDGTREFLAERSEFTVNVAIIVDGRPTAGVIAAPALGLIWRGVVGSGADRLVLAPGSPAHAARERAALHTRRCPSTAMVAAVSRSHLDPQTSAFIARRPDARILTCGSSLKFCRLAEGGADVYPRLAPTSEWDVAAGDALVTAAGGIVVAPSGDRLAYGRVDADFRIPAFIAWGDPKAALSVA